MRSMPSKSAVIILFGAGVYAKKYKALLEYLHMDFHYFTDNDETKWGKMLYDKPVISPYEIKNYPECKLIISCTHEAAIRKQLEEMGLADKIVCLNDLYDLCGQKIGFQHHSQICDDAERTVIIDMYEGIGWGGTELWAANLACGLHQRGKHVILIGSTEQPPLEEKHEALAVRVATYDTIMKMVDLLGQNLPCIFINNFAGCAFMAAAIIKKKYPDKLKIVSVIHNDNESLFNAHMFMAEYIDSIFCVSNQIKEHMQVLYPFEDEKYYFKEQPIELDGGRRRDNNFREVLRIGYAARLVRQQKRADLLPDLITLLVKRNIEFLFQIAGEGECLEKIETFVKEKHLENKVQLLGRIPKGEMNYFWKQQDIFVNISEYEGTSLAMLEAMSFGCVPVVTDVSGAREFIITGENGYICDVGDLEQMADDIAEIYEDKGRLERYGEKCQEIIEERCDPEQYLDYWINHLL